MNKLTQVIKNRFDARKTASNIGSLNILDLSHLSPKGVVLPCAAQIDNYIRQILAWQGLNRFGRYFFRRTGFAA